MWDSVGDCDDELIMIVVLLMTVMMVFVPMVMLNDGRIGCSSDSGHDMVI